MRRGPWYVLATVACGGVIAAGLDRSGVMETPDRARPLALIFLGVAVALAGSTALHRLLGYTAQAQTKRQRRDAVALARAVTYEACLAVYFVAAFLAMREWPAEAWECALAALGYAAMLVIYGRVHHLAERLELVSITGALLTSPAADDLRTALDAWRGRNDAPSSPPGVDVAAQRLGSLPEVGKTSAAMGFVATLLATVVVANAGAAIDSAGSLAGGIVAAKDGGPPPSRQSPPGRQSTPVAPLTQPAAMPPVGKPTEISYATRCGRGSRPGRGAPASIAGRLYDLWLGPAGVGGRVGGCAERARQVRSGAGAWYVVGRRDGVLQSVGVAGADGSSALLLGDAARVALTRALDGTLERASARARVKGGDLQIVDTTTGSFVLVRAEIGSGTRARYTLVPPGLVGVWLAAVRNAGWVWPVSESSDAGVFRFRTDAGTAVGAARCADAIQCAARIHGVTTRTSTGTHATLLELTQPN